jgi:hypothetical protein
MGFRELPGADSGSKQNQLTLNGGSGACKVLLQNHRPEKSEPFKDRAYLFVPWRWISSKELKLVTGGFGPSYLLHLVLGVNFNTRHSIGHALADDRFLPLAHACQM